MSAGSSSGYSSNGGLDNNDTGTTKPNRPIGNNEQLANASSSVDTTSSGSSDDHTGSGSSVSNGNSGKTMKPNRPIENNAQSTNTSSSVDTNSYSPYGESGILLPDRSISELEANKQPIESSTNGASSIGASSGSNVGINRSTPKANPISQGSGLSNAPANSGSSSSSSSISGSNVGTKRNSPKASFVSTSADEGNPFFKPTVFGGSRRGAETASFKARAYNTGLKWRGMGGKTRKATRDFTNSIKNASVDLSSVSRPEKDIKIYNRRE